MRVKPHHRTGHHVDGHYRYCFGHRIRVKGHHRSGHHVKGHLR